MVEEEWNGLEVWFSGRIVVKSGGKIVELIWMITSLTISLALNFH